MNGGAFGTRKRNADPAIETPTTSQRASIERVAGGLMAGTATSSERRTSRAPLVIACIAEVGTGLLVLAFPVFVSRLLFGQEVEGTGVIVGRLAGIALVALGIACWPGGRGQQPLIGMLAYSFLATLYLGTLAIVGMAGVLLWPAVLMHGVLTALLARACATHRKEPDVGN